MGPQPQEQPRRRLATASPPPRPAPHPQRQTPQRHSTTTPNATTPPPLFRLRCPRQTPAGASDAYVLCVQATQKKKNLPSNSSWCERRVRSLRASNAKKKEFNGRPDNTCAAAPSVCV